MSDRFFPDMALSHDEPLLLPEPFGVTNINCSVVPSHDGDEKNSLSRQWSRNDYQDGSQHPSKIVFHNVTFLWFTSAIY